MDGGYMKSLVNIFFCLIVALISTPVTFAAESEQVVEEKPTTDLKSGDVIILEGITIEPNNVNATAKPAEAPVEDKEVPVETKTKEATEVKESQPSTKLEVNYDKNAAEVNKRVNEEIREKEKAKEEDKAPQTPAQKPINNQAPEQKPKDQVSPEVKKLVDEIDKFLKEVPAEKPAPSTSTTTTTTTPNTRPQASNNQEIKKTVDLVTEVVSSNKISKAESEKIATATQLIIQEYNKRIEAAPTEEKKQELRNEAVEKINQSIKETSTEAYAYITENKDKLTIDDQKNEEIDIEAAVENDEIDETTDRNKDYTSETKEIHIEKSPKLNQELDAGPTRSMTIVIIVILVLVIALSVLLALRHYEKQARK